MSHISLNTNISIRVLRVDTFISIEIYDIIFLDGGVMDFYLVFVL